FILPLPWRVEGKVYNCALLVDGGAIVHVVRKSNLPNYGVFDERRVFAAAPPPTAVHFRGVRIGIMICEDMWTDDAALRLMETGAEMLIVVNASPYETTKHARRMDLARMRVSATGLPLIYLNQVGGQDELVFDGASFI